MVYALRTKKSTLFFKNAKQTAAHDVKNMEKMFALKTKSGKLGF